MHIRSLCHLRDVAAGSWLGCLHNMRPGVVTSGLFVFLPDLSGSLVDFARLDQGKHAATEAAANHSRTKHAAAFIGDCYQLIDFVTTNLEVIPETGMRNTDQFPQFYEVVALQSGICVADALILTHNVTAAPV
jgi:hypothetical protein